MTNKRTLQAQETKKKLFEAAQAIVLRKGYEGLSVRAIARLAQTSTGNFYTYFKSKDDVLTYFFDIAIAEYNKNSKIDPAQNSAEQNFIRFYQWFADYLTKLGKDFCRAFYSTSNRSLDIKNYYNKLMATTEAFAKQYAHQHPAVNVDYDKVNKNVCVIVKGAIVDWCVSCDDYRLADYCTELITTYFAGLNYQLQKAAQQDQND